VHFVPKQWAVRRLHIVAPKVLRLGRYTKRAILVIADLTVLSLAMWFAFALRLGEFFVPTSWDLFLLLSAAPLIGVVTFFQLGIYRVVTRFMGTQVAMLLLTAVGLSTLFWALIVLLSGYMSIPRSVVLLYPLLGGAGVWGSRRVAGWLLTHAGVELPARVAGNERNVVIYGAGKTGIQLVEALRTSRHYTPIGFIDPSPTIWGQYIAGLKVYRPERMAGILQRHDVREVLLALPNTDRRERQAALRQLESLKVVVRTLPAIEDLASCLVNVCELLPV
jgi:FlaA1/EpsC-like NDP-sugar epimerase